MLFKHKAVKCSKTANCKLYFLSSLILFPVRFCSDDYRQTDLGAGYIINYTQAVGLLTPHDGKQLRVVHDPSTRPRRKIHGTSRLALELKNP